MVVEVELAQMRSLIFSLRAVVEVEEVLWDVVEEVLWDVVEEVLWDVVEEVLWDVVEEVLWDVVAEVAEWVMEQALIGYFEVI